MLGWHQKHSLQQRTATKALRIFVRKKNLSLHSHKIEDKCELEMYSGHDQLCVTWLLAMHLHKLIWFHFCHRSHFLFWKSAKPPHGFDSPTNRVLTCAFFRAECGSFFRCAIVSKATKCSMIKDASLNSWRENKRQFCENQDLILFFETKSYAQKQTVLRRLLSMRHFVGWGKKLLTYTHVCVLMINGSHFVGVWLELKLSQEETPTVRACRAHSHYGSCHPGATCPCRHHLTREISSTT